MKAKDLANFVSGRVAYNGSRRCRYFYSAPSGVGFGISWRVRAFARLVLKANWSTMESRETALERGAASDFAKEFLCFMWDSGLVAHHAYGKDTHS